MPKQVTNEDLAVMIKNGFDAADGRFDSVDSRLVGVEGQMLKVHDRLRTVEDKLDRVLYKEMDRLEVRVKRLEQKAGFKSVS